MKKRKRTREQKEAIKESEKLRKELFCNFVSKPGEIRKKTTIRNPEKL